LLSRFDFLLPEVRFSPTGDFGRSAPHALPSRPVGYFCPVLTADGKLDCAPK